MSFVELGNAAPSNYSQEPTPQESETPQVPIDLLKPGSELHGKVLKHVQDRLRMSERAMAKFYDRWRVNEKKVQAYIDLPDFEQQLKELTNSGKPANPVSITVPYAFATIWTVVTYLIHTYCGRKPMFPVGSHQAEAVDAAQMMETVLQYNAEHIRLIRTFFQWFLDGEVYGCGVVRTLWEQEEKMRTVWVEGSPGGAVTPGLPAKKMRTRQKRVVFEGNNVMSVDPFMFFPDPRVPMVECNRRGEFVFWRTFEGKHTLKQAEAAGLLKWVDSAPQIKSSGTGESGGTSSRSLRSQGEPSPGDPGRREYESMPFYQVDQGTVWIVPSELELGETDEQELWVFTILNGGQLAQAEPLDLDHGMHPVSVIEPYSFGYGFGQMGLADMLGPMQDLISWFVNSHIHNVRSVLNNQLVVDPSMIEMQDVKNPEPGKIIRLKRSAFGQDVRGAINQLEVRDITRSHVSDMHEVVRLGDSMAAVNDNLRGIVQSGGRKTATEVRTSGEAGASRLAAHARLVSAQGIVDLTEQMSLNIQQNLSMSFYLKIVGQEGMEKPIQIGPEMLVGDFYYPVSDGSLPIDKVALLDIWKEILFGVAGDPVLRGNYDLVRMFEWVAELGGARNISQFKLDPGSQEAMFQQLLANNVGPENGPGTTVPQPAVG